MSGNRKNKEDKDPNLDLEYFQELLGNYLKHLRIKAGYTNARDFATAINISESQYGYYESGKKDMRLSTLKKIFLAHNIRVEDLFKINLINPEQENHALQILVRRKTIEQAREQVKSLNGESFANKLADIELERLISILIFCIRPKSKNEILTKLGLTNTVNNFKRVTALAQENKWINKTDQENPNSPKQKYLTTQAGLEIIQKVSNLN